MGSELGIGLADAIEQVRADLLKARSAGEGADVRLPVQSVTVELAVVASREIGAKAGFRVPFVEVGGTGTMSAERTSTVTVTFGAPVDRDGSPIQIAQSGNDKKR